MVSNTGSILGQIEAEEVVISGKHILWDHNFQLPGKNLVAERKVDSGEAKLEVYDYPGFYAERFDGIDAGGGEQGSNLQKIFDDNARVADIRSRETGAHRRTLHNLNVTLSGEARALLEEVEPPLVLYFALPPSVTATDTTGRSVREIVHFGEAQAHRPGDYKAIAD